MVPEWANNYPAFEAWCFAHGYEPGRHIKPIRRGLMGPSNCRITNPEAKVKVAEEYIPAAGYSHRPCLACTMTKDETRCPYVSRRKVYWDHWNETMRVCRVNTGLEGK